MLFIEKVKCNKILSLAIVRFFTTFLRVKYYFLGLTQMHKFLLTFSALKQCQPQHKGADIHTPSHNFLI